MSRSAFWTILIGESPTAFRAREAADLQPTLVQLQRTQPDAVMKWFERGRIWTSPEEAMETQRAERQVRRTRSRDWRPGGAHADVRLAYKRAKQAKWDRLRGKPAPRPPEARPPAGGPPLGKAPLAAPAGRPPSRPPRSPARAKAPGGPRFKPRGPRKGPKSR